MIEEINDKENSSLPGYPLYPSKDDIYNNAKEEKNLNPEDSTKNKSQKERLKNNEKDFKDDVSGSDLDVHCSDLDDDQENVGSEDEENNYYSLGGDNHENLDKDKAGI